MRVNEIYPYNTVELTKAGLNMKYSDLGELWENSNDMEKNLKNRRKGIGQGKVFPVSYSHSCGRGKYIVSSKELKNIKLGFK